MPALLALLLLIGGGVSVAAEQSVPGDFLYPVKINFNEEVRSILAVTDQDEARWHTEAAERRLSEAEILTERGTLDETTRLTLEEEFVLDVTSVQESTTNLVAAGELAVASDIILNLEAALSAHQQIITDLTRTVDTALSLTSATSTDGTAVDGTLGTETLSALQISLSELGKLALKVNDKLEEVSISREAVDVQLLAAADREDEAELLATNREKSAERRLAQVRANLEKRREVKGSGSGIDAEARLLAAENALDRGRVSIGDKDYTGAYRRYQEAVKQALEADSFLRAEEERDNLPVLDSSLDGDASLQVGTSDAVVDDVVGENQAVTDPDALPFNTELPEQVLPQIPPSEDAPAALDISASVPDALDGPLVPAEQSF